MTVWYSSVPLITTGTSRTVVVTDVLFSTSTWHQVLSQHFSHQDACACMRRSRIRPACLPAFCGYYENWANCCSSLRLRNLSMRANVSLGAPLWAVRAAPRGTAWGILSAKPSAQASARRTTVVKSSPLSSQRRSTQSSRPQRLQVGRPGTNRMLARTDNGHNQRLPWDYAQEGMTAQLCATSLVPESEASTAPQSEFDLAAVCRRLG